MSFVSAVQNIKIVPAAKPTPTSQVNYSESASYQPREFAPNKKEKKKDKSKSDKSKSDETSQTSASITAQTANEDSVLSIPISVYDENGQPVTKLEKADFKLFIDEEEVEFESFQTQGEPLNVFLVLDTSASVSFEIKNIRRFAKELIASLEPSANIQLIELGEKASIVSELTSDRQILSKAVSKLQEAQGTSIYDSIASIMKKQINSVAEHKIIILLTDGVDTTSTESNYKISLIEAEKQDAVVYPFYINMYEQMNKSEGNPLAGILARTITIINTGDNSESLKEQYDRGRNYLSDLANLSGGRTFQVQDISKIKGAELERAIENYSPRYYIGTKLKASVSGQRRIQIKVRISKPNLTVFAKSTYISGDNEK